MINIRGELTDASAREEPLAVRSPRKSIHFQHAIKHVLGHGTVSLTHLIPF